MAVLQLLLSYTNAHRDDVCSVCLDSNISVRFEPCGHEACCDECATMMTSCCMCRKDIVSTKSAERNKKKLKRERKQEEGAPALDTVQDCVRYLCMFTDLGESAYRDKRNMRKLRSLARTVEGKRVNRKKKKNKRSGQSK